VKRGILWVVAVAIVLALTGSVQAEENNNDREKPWEKGAITFGSFFSGTNSNVRVGVPGIGLNIDVEEALGLETTTTVFRTDGFWRFTDNLRHRLDFTWFALRRSGDATLARDITIDGVTIPLGSKVDSSLDLDIYKLGYSYSFFQDDRMDLAVGAGLFITPISFEFSATGAISNYTSESVTAPLPVLGLRADFAITPKWMLKNGLDLFYLELGDFKGSVVDFKSNLEYNWFENFGVGVGVESFNLNVEAEGSDYPEVDFVGAFGFKYIGAMIYAKLYF
jgi:hypothetical protein